MLISKMYQRFTHQCKNATLDRFEYHQDLKIRRDRFQTDKSVNDKIEQ